MAASKPNDPTTAVTMLMHVNPGGTIPITTANFLTAFKLIAVSNAIKTTTPERKQALDNHRYCVQRLEQIMDCKFYCPDDRTEDATDKDRGKLVRWRDNHHLLLELGKRLVQVEPKFYTVAHINWQHRQLEQHLLDKLSYRERLFSWPVSNFSHFAPDPSMPIGWQQLDSCYIWIWIHVLAYHACTDGVLVDQFELIDRIMHWIDCGTCYHHYMSKSTIIRQRLSAHEANVYRLLLELHESLRMERQKQPPENDKEPPPVVPPVQLSPETKLYDSRYRCLFTTLYTMYRTGSCVPAVSIQERIKEYRKRYERLDSDSDGDEQDATGLTEDDFTDDETPNWH